MTDKQSLCDKYIIDKLPRTCLMRKRLIKKFDLEADKRVIFVSAPAGYGKTVTTQLWLSDTAIKTLWISLDSYDNTPSIFYKLFCTGILSLQPDNTEMSKILASQSFSSSPVEHTIRLLSEFIPDGRQYALVLDDIHLITNKELLKSGLLVRKRLPSSFLTVILTRNEIAEEYKAAIGEGRYALITASDLMFSVDEIQQFFFEYGRTISAEDAVTVHSNTDGWAIGVKALVMSGMIDPGQNSGRILGNYIKSQLWDGWDEDLRVFMLQTSITDEVPVTLCKQLTGRDDSRELLEALCASNSFISRQSDDVYCYHNLFLEFLRNQINEYHIDVDDICKKTVLYYRDRGEYFVARQFASKIEDTNTIMSVIFHLSRYGSASLDEFVNYTKLFSGETLPENLCDRAPSLYATLMWENYLLGNAAKMEYYMDKVYRFMPIIFSEFPQYSETVLMQISLDHRISLSVLAEQYSSIPPLTYEHDGQQGATLTHEMPFLHRSNRDYSELADDSVREKMIDTFGRLFRSNRDLIFAAIESGIYLEKSQLKEALSAAERAKKLVDETTSSELHFCVSVHLVAAHYALNNPEYTALIREAEHVIEKSGSHNLRPNFIAFKTKQLLLNGDRKAAKDWLDNYFVTDDEPLELYKIYQYFTTAKAYIVLGHTDKATRYVMKLKKLAADFRRLLDIAEANVLHAILEWVTGRKPEAQLILEDVLNDLQPYGFVRVVSIEGAAVLPILRRLETKLKKDECSGSLNAHYVHKVTLAAYEQSKRCKGITAHIKIKPIKLSKQQSIILSMLSDGYKYTEIADTTGITIHTVKSHASAVYRKLDVHNSMDASVKAAELGLI